MIPIVTYTHSNCRDLWEGYENRLSKFANGHKSIFVTDIATGMNSNDHIDIIYNNDLSFTCQMVTALEQISELGYENFIYSQEDFILYDYVNNDVLLEAVNIIESEKSDFV